jgi:uncharacterized protein (DUF1697 family)
LLRRAGAQARAGLYLVGWQDGLMPTHVALLRGINVGGGGKLAMADLRQVVSALGHSDVATYIQTGNVVFTAARTDAAALARELEAAIASELNVRTSVIVLSRDELAAAVGANPYPAEPNPRYVHGVFLPAEPDEAMSRAVREAVAAAARAGSADEATLLGQTLYLHTPDGFGTSELARTLLQKRGGPGAAGTARNWATVTKLLALCDG